MVLQRLLIEVIHLQLRHKTQFGFSATTRTFTITTTDPDDLLYSNIYDSFIETNDRTTFRNFISDPTYFYRNQFIDPMILHLVYKTTLKF